jgi:hypothetical protein
MIRTVVHRLKIVDQGQDIPVTHGDLLQNRDFVSDLADISLSLASAGVR